jgi:hypothetical protein
MSKYVTNWTIDPSLPGDKALSGQPAAFRAVLESGRSIIELRLTAGPTPALREQAAALRLSAADSEAAAPAANSAAGVAAEAQAAEESTLAALRRRGEELAALAADPALLTDPDGAAKLVALETQAAAQAKLIARQEANVAAAVKKAQAAWDAHAQAVEQLRQRRFAALQADLDRRREQLLARLASVAAPVLDELVAVSLALGGPSYGVFDRPGVGAPAA